MERLFKTLKVLEFNQYKKSHEAPFTIYGDLKCLIQKIYGCKNNPKVSSKIKVSEAIPSCFSMCTIS